MPKHLSATLHSRWLRGLPLLALLAGACSDNGDGGGGGEPPSGIDLSRVALAPASGNGQTGPAGGRFAQPLVVTVRTSDGAPAPYVRVRFARVAGTVTLLDSIAVTDFDGVARATPVLGATPGAVRLVAAVVGFPDKSATFDGTIVPPPTITAVTPASFGAGDTVTVTASDLAVLGTTAAVTFDGERGLVVPGSRTATSLRVVAPPCLAAGQTTLRLVDGPFQSPTATATSVSRTRPLQLGEFQAVTLPASATGCLALAGGARYALLPSFAATQDFAVGRTRDSVPGFGFVLGATGAPVARVAAPRPRPTGDVAADFHRFLRWQEQQLAPEAAAAFRARRGVLAEGVNLSLGRNDLPAVGSTRQFQVLNSLTASPSTYSTVTARLVFAGDNILLYVDQATPGVANGGVADASYATLGAQFDDDLYPIAARTFAASSDIDGNRRVFVLFTPVVNGLSTDRAECGGYIAGFFNGADLVASNTRANRAEIFYGAVPGAAISSVASCRLSVNAWQRSTPATFIHELQHLISYGQHVLSRGGASEDIWLNEALSHVAEELGGRLYEQRFPPPSGRTDPAQLFPDAAQGFLPPNFSNAYDFFRSSTEFSLTSPTAFGTLEERGVGWLFLRWLGDQRGEAIYGQLVQTNRTGTANVEQVAGEPFTRLFADYVTAVLLDDFPGADASRINPRWQFTSRDLRAIYARLNAIDRTNFPVPYPLDLATLPASARLGPGSSVTGTMKPGGFDLFELRVPGGAATTAFRASSGTFQPSLNAQLTIVRVPGAP